MFFSGGKFGRFTLLLFRAFIFPSNSPLHPKKGMILKCFFKYPSNMDLDNPL